MDRAHIFVVNMFDDFDRFMKVPDEWAPPEFKPYSPGVMFHPIYSFQCFFLLCFSSVPVLNYASVIYLLAIICNIFLFCMLFTWISWQENLQKWLTDEKARDQFVIRAGSDTEVLWNDARHLKPEPVYKRTVSGIVFNFIFFIT